MFPRLRGRYRLTVENRCFRVIRERERQTDKETDREEAEQCSPNAGEPDIYITNELSDVVNERYTYVRFGGCFRNSEPV